MSVSDLDLEVCGFFGGGKEGLGITALGFKRKKVSDDL